MLQYDGILGDRTDPLMQDWVALDEHISSRLFAKNTYPIPEQTRMLRDQYVPLRLAMFEYIKDLNNDVLFYNNQVNIQTSIRHV